MEHILYVTHIKINKTQLYLTIQLPKPDLKLRAELYYQNSSQDFHHPLRCISRTSQKLIFQMDVSVLENGENDWDLLIRSDKTSESWTVILGARLRTQLSSETTVFPKWLSVFPYGKHRTSFHPSKPSSALL